MPNQNPSNQSPGQSQSQSDASSNREFEGLDQEKRRDMTSEGGRSPRQSDTNSDRSSSTPASGNNSSDTNRNR